jgi:hypothetical protein
VLDGQSAVRVFVVAGGSLALSGVTIANGNGDGAVGGGINITSGSVTVSGSVFVGNKASNGAAIANPAAATLSVDTSTFQNNAATSVGGGCLINFGTATVSNSSFIGNMAPINAGAINTQSGATTTVTNSTFSGNSTEGVGGALSNLGALAVFDSTFSANQASAGSAIATGTATVTVDNSIFADNAAAGTPGAFSPPPPSIAASNNVFYNNTAAGTADDKTGYGTSNFIAAPVEPLQALGNYGGPTQTLLPLRGRAATCAGSVALLPPGLTQDQRGLARVTISISSSCLDAGSDQVGNGRCPPCRCRCSPCSAACWRSSASAAGGAFAGREFGSGGRSDRALARHGNGRSDPAMIAIREWFE